MAALSVERCGDWMIDKFSSRRITVVGDVMLDRFLIGRVSRMSPEAPVPVVVFDHEEFRLGGAANVAHNLRVRSTRLATARPVAVSPAPRYGSYVSSPRTASLRIISFAEATDTPRASAISGMGTGSG